MELLLVSHKGIASGMKSAVQMVMGDLADKIRVLELTEEEGISRFGERLEETLVSWLTEGKKGLVFADLKGGTPYNQAELLLTKHGLKSRAKVISGLNLPMVVEALLGEIDVCSTAELLRLVQAARDSVACLELEAQASDLEDE